MTDEELIFSTQELKNLKKSLVDIVWNYPDEFSTIYTNRHVIKEIYPDLFKKHDYFVHLDRVKAVQDYYTYIKLFKWPKEPLCVEETIHYMALLCRILRKYDRGYLG
jgi:hypothetical protein